MNDAEVQELLSARAAYWPGRPGCDFEPLPSDVDKWYGWLYDVPLRTARYVMKVIALGGGDLPPSAGEVRESVRQLDAGR